MSAFARAMLASLTGGKAAPLPDLKPTKPASGAAERNAGEGDDDEAPEKRGGLIGPVTRGSFAGVLKAVDEGVTTAALGTAGCSEGAEEGD